LLDQLSQLDVLTTSSRQLLIDGELVTGGEEMSLTSPCDGSSLGNVPLAGPELVADAVDAATRAFPAWRATNLRERQAALLALAQHLSDDLAGLAALDAVDGGLPLVAAGNDVRLSVAFIRYIAGLAFDWGGRTVPTASKAFDFTIRQPYGPTARIVPFNHPILFATWKIAAPLLTGNTIVLKLPDQSPLSGLRLCTALREIFPPGVVNVLSGSGAVTGDALVRHPGIKRIAFIGSVPTGRLILSAAAERNVPVTAELGGKNAHIVAADADLDRAVRSAVAGMNYQGAGQSCGSYSRVLVQDRVYDEFVERLAAATAEIKVGHPFTDGTTMGPLIGPAAVSRALASIEEASQAHARVVCGGTVPDVPDGNGGHYLAPTVVADVTHVMRIAQEELFAPVQAVMKWSTVEEAASIANGTEFGLCASVHTRDLNLAMSLADELEVGSIAVNGDGAQHWMGAPFGGVKASGVGGKEDTVDELLESTYEKNVFVSFG
jgi:acyl-CoA reductase-like NAD-dependent aldehyde dehydrogenase